MLASRARRGAVRARRSPTRWSPAGMNTAILRAASGTICLKKLRRTCHRRCRCRRWQLAVRISSKSPGRRDQFLHNVGSFHQPGSTSMLVARVAIRRRSALGRNSVFRVAFGSGHDDAHADLNVSFLRICTVKAASLLPAQKLPVCSAPHRSHSGSRTLIRSGTDGDMCASLRLGSPTSMVASHEARRTLLICRVTIAPSRDQSYLIEPPSCRETVRSTSLLPNSRSVRIGRRGDFGSASFDPCHDNDVILLTAGDIQLPCICG